MKLSRLWPALALIVLLGPSSVTADAHPSRLGKGAVISIPCGVSEVPFSVYSMPITQTETLTVTFDSQGSGLVTFNVNNFEHAYWARTLGNTGTHNTLKVSGVTRGPYDNLQILVTAAASDCPSSGMVVGNFSLTVTPNPPTVK